MGAARPILGLVSLILTAGGILLQFLVILSGIHTYAVPLNLVYFLQADTSGISNAPNPARWTFFSICGVGPNGHNANCGPIRAALPFDPPNSQDFGTTNGVPPAFIGTNHYYYLSRFMFAFYLIALFFAVLALFTGVLALCTRIGSFLSGANAALALFFQTITAALMTACFVQGRDAFRRNGQTASLGRYAFGFTWAAMACFLLATVSFCIGGSVSKDSKRNRRRGGSNAGGFLGRNKSTRSRASRGSFVTDGSGRVKEEYEP
ncbi:hypothetical protein LTS18_006438 [Coniosporium uncinatum]|uniref:Uncharacterized protein n=1 Tax=Coniosporium uncinatum TaxID=93489 RepID=A0ACC3DQI0_9PEZI|nr:hypothetical protein LTS18_006438 [Coniosporium uncinatum]